MAKIVFFQNNDDLNLFTKNKLVSEEKSRLIPGSGVDTNKFIPSKNINNDTLKKFIFIGRLIYDKGILEYIDAIRSLKPKYPNVSFDILGPFYEKFNVG